MRALLNDHKIVDFTQSLPDFRELHEHQLPEERADADIRKIIAFPANRAALGGIVSVLVMVKRLFHEPGEGNRAAIPNLIANELNQLGIPGLCPQRPTRLRLKLRRGKRLPRRSLGVGGLSAGRLPSRLRDRP